VVEQIAGSGTGPPLPVHKHRNISESFPEGPANFGGRSYTTRMWTLTVESRAHNIAAR